MQSSMVAAVKFSVGSIILVKNLIFDVAYKKVTLSTQLINPKFCVSLPHRRSTAVSLETNALVYIMKVLCRYMNICIYLISK